MGLFKLKLLTGSVSNGADMPTRVYRVRLNRDEGRRAGDNAQSRGAWGVRVAGDVGAGSYSSSKPLRVLARVPGVQGVCRLVFCSR